VWLWSRDPFNVLLAPKISPERLKLEWAWSQSRDIFNFWEISDNNSKMVQDRCMVSIKVE